MRNQIKYSQIYADVLATIGDDMASSFCYVPKRVVVRMWEKILNNNYISLTDHDIEIIYDL